MERESVEQLTFHARKLLRSVDVECPRIDRFAELDMGPKGRMHLVSTELSGGHVDSHPTSSNRASLSL